jgi:hypothetical protein
MKNKRINLLIALIFASLHQGKEENKNILPILDHRKPSHPQGVNGIIEW